MADCDSQRHMNIVTANRMENGVTLAWDSNPLLLAGAQRWQLGGG